MKNKVAASLGHDKKLTHRRNHRKRSFKRKVKNYLKADCFLYAPLISHSPSDLSPPSKTLDSSAAGLKRNESSKPQPKKKLLQRVLAYLLSDSHMYAAFIDSPASVPVECIEKLTITTSRKTTTPVTNPTSEHVMEARQTRRYYRLSSDSGSMNRELRRLVT